MSDNTDNQDDRTRLPSASILGKHSRDKKKLIPPIMGLQGIQMVSTIDSIVPEIIWVGVLLERYGLRSGIELASDILSCLWNHDRKQEWCRFSVILQNSATLHAVIDYEIMQKLALVFAPFKSVYSLDNIDWVNSEAEHSDYIKEIENAVGKYSDRYEQPYLIMLSTVVYSMGISGKVQFGPGTLPDIEAIVTNWGSPESQLAAAEVRAFSMAFFPQDRAEASEEWCRKFWQVNYKISGCDL
ncbi:hypothetical protein [Porphyrobacter sp. YT40]|uniref:hypothetical protein n=1 Tax=Porphyrobacter sp. YT40 TaxID=2547601 RepID=UPI0011412698|nr:hypothetical protein [Porphyrobacter sp. YT40]QDH34577.1 hypothetical protein E2E27_09715 [Porphyrobacter sp. YT40]